MGRSCSPTQIHKPARKRCQEIEIVPEFSYTIRRYPAAPVLRAHQSLAHLLCIKYAYASLYVEIWRIRHASNTGTKEAHQTQAQSSIKAGSIQLHLSL